ncbi:MAG: Clp protease ClpP, partial [Clostridia bacterium]|nr:Clp protease ClpP [Clostridia bacterium]
MKKFWNFIRNDEGERILRLEGPVDEDNFWGDEVTPKAFREELEAEDGDVTVWINSPGGNVFAAAEIYTMLCDHKGHITVKIDAIAASAASVIAMAVDRVLMSPVAMLMIHDPMTIAMGNAKDMEKAIATLNEVKASIINAYQKKTGLSRNKISQLMEDETWMNAKKAVELGFADEILFSKKDEPKPEESEEEKHDGKEIEASWQPYSTKAMGQRVLGRLVSAAEIPPIADEEPDEAIDAQADVEPAETGVTEPAVESAAEQPVTDVDKPKPDEDDPDEEESEEDEPDEDAP